MEMTVGFSPSQIWWNCWARRNLLCSSSTK